MTQDTPTLRDVSEAYKRHAGLLAMVIAGFVVLSISLTLLPEAKYYAEAQVLVNDSAAEAALDLEVDDQLLLREVFNNMTLAESDAVLGELEREYGEPLRDRTRVRSDLISDLLRFEGEGPSAEQAAALANDYANKFVAVKRTQALDSLDSTVTQLQARLIDVRSRRSELQAPISTLERAIEVAPPENVRSLVNELAKLRSESDAELSFLDGQITSLSESITRLDISAQVESTGTARIASAATLPQAGTHQLLGRNVVLGVLLGLVVASMLLAAIEGLDTKIRTSATLRHLVSVPLLGTVPHQDSRRQAVELETIRRTGSPTANAYHQIRAGLDFALRDTTAQSVLIASPGQAEGKTTTALNLAGSLASTGRSIIVVDSNFYAPRFADLFPHRPKNVDLVDCIEGTLPCHELGFQPVDSMQELCLIACGSSTIDPLAMMRSGHLIDTLDHAVKEADLTLVDGPPLVSAAGGMQLMLHVDAVVVVVHASRTRRRDLEEMIQLTHDAGSPILGVVLTGVKASRVHPAIRRLIPDRVAVKSWFGRR